MGVVGVVVFEIGGQTLLEFRCRCEFATVQKTTLQDAKPQLDLIQPGTMFWREVKHMFVRRIRQERSSIGSTLKRFGVKGNLTPLGNELANVQAPVCVQVVDDPVILFHRRESRHGMTQMRYKVLTRSCLTEGPRDWACRYGKRVDQHTSTVADVLVLAAFSNAGNNRLGGVFTLENLHARFLIAANDQPALLIELRRGDVQLADISRLLVKVGIMAVEPILTLVRLQVGLFQDSPDRRATHRFGMVLIQNRSGDVVQTPASGVAIVVRGRAEAPQESPRHGEVPSTLLLAAISFAARVHRDQTRKDGVTPYVAHPFRVVTILATGFGVEDPEVLAAAALHAATEDTETDHDDLVEHFGERVAQYVAILSKDNRLRDKAREQAHLKQLADAPIEVKLCKLADAYDNLLDSAHLPKKMQTRTIKRAKQLLEYLAPSLPSEWESALELVRQLIETTSGGLIRHEGKVASTTSESHSEADTTD